MRVLWFFQWVAHLPQNKPDLWLPIGAFPMGIWELQHRRPPKGGIYQQICARGIQRSPANILICFCAPLSGLPLMCAVLTELMLFVMEHETNKKSPETGHSFTLFSELRFFRQFFDNPSLFYLSLVNCMLLRISSTRIGCRSLIITRTSP